MPMQGGNQFIDQFGNAVMGGLGSVPLDPAALSGFLYIPAITDEPSAIPIGNYPGMVPVVWDIANHELWVRDPSGWVSVSSGGGGGGTSVNLQASFPGSQQTGHFNVSGNGLVGTTLFVGPDFTLDVIPPSSNTASITAGGILTSGQSYQIQTRSSIGPDNFGGTFTVSTSGTILECSHNNGDDSQITNYFATATDSGSNTFNVSFGIELPGNAGTSGDLVLRTNGLGTDNAGVELIRGYSIAGTGIFLFGSSASIGVNRVGGLTLPSGINVLWDDGAGSQGAYIYGYQDGMSVLSLFDIVDITASGIMHPGSFGPPFVDIGAVGKPFRDGFFSGNIDAASYSVGGTPVFSGTTTFTTVDLKTVTVLNGFIQSVV